MAFGPCIDAITPTAEDCASPADEDCDGDPGCPPDPDHAWSELFLATQYSSGDALAVGPGGRVVVAGQFRGTFFPGAETHSAPTGDGLDRVYVAAYDDDGAPLWSRS
ncbi:MAG: hypothetical protein KC636_21640, partial [Myxococcales bacterium]|nr:hypothetical protein [Myxococcales bacterium]